MQRPLPPRLFMLRGQVICHVDADGQHHTGAPADPAGYLVEEMRVNREAVRQMWEQRAKARERSRYH